MRDAADIRAKLALVDAALAQTRRKLELLTGIRQAYLGLLRLETEQPATNAGRSPNPTRSAAQRARWARHHEAAGIERAASAPSEA